jgi:hypothetical protein
MAGSHAPIPKFASFRPKPTPPVEIEERHKPKKEDRGPSKHHKQQPQPRGESHDAPLRSKDEPLWVVDRKGDVQNLVYGSVHRYSIPPFHRSGGGRVVGASPSLKIDRGVTDEKSIVLVDRRDLNSIARERNVFSKIEKVKPRLLKIRPELLVEPSVSEELDFVPLAPKGRKRKSEELNDSNSDDETSYRSVHGKRKPIDQPADEVFQYATESESSGYENSTTLNSSVDKKAIQLSQRVEQSPHDIDAWLALIEHQGSHILNDDRRQATNAEIRSTADIRIHMYEKALGYSRSLHHKERLLLGLMAEGSKIWEIKEQARRWEQISGEHIDSLLLWRSYVDFKQATFTIFRREEVRDVFLQRIKLLLDAISTSIPDAVDSLYTQLVYVVLRFTIFTRQSGYSELAIAIWQGILEFNFFAPPTLSSYEEKVASFKEFWESEVPRIGEEGACGWRHFVDNAHSINTAPILIDETHDSLNNRDLFRSWAISERLRGKASLVLGRMMDEVVEDDPFRVILFSDIEELLVPLPTHAERLRRLTLNAYLLFCNQPPLDGSDREVSAIPGDPFIRGELLDTDANWARREYLSTPGDPGNRDDELASTLRTPWSNVPGAPELSFSNMWYSGLVAWRDTYPHDNGPIRYKSFRNALLQLIQADTADDIAVYYLGLEWKNGPDTIKKTAKQLLKQRPASLGLYNAYGMIEWSRRNRDVAQSVFSAAINMSSSMSENDRKDSIMLWKSWVWLSLDDLDYKSALGRLLSIVDCSTSNCPDLTPAGLLKTKQHLSSNRDFLISNGDLKRAILYAECLVLLDYLTANLAAGTTSGTQGDISTAMSTASDFSQTLIERGMGTSVFHELFLQSAARLLYHHARAGPFRPAFVREQLTKFIELFPQNLIFLSLYESNEARLRIENRVRNIFVSKVLVPENDTLTSRLFAIRYEARHGTIHSVRSSFENALSSPSSKSSAGLWKLYILFCLQTPQFQSRAKEIWFRAIKACPWAKEIYLLGFERLDRLVSFKEFKETWKIMGEKELRVHVDLEDIFDDMQELDDVERR